MALITEYMLRKQFYQQGLSGTYTVSKKDILTPSAYDFLKEKKIEVITEDQQEISSEITFSKPLYKDEWETPQNYKNFYTNELMQTKPEFMTHLFENVLVDKDDDRIVLRGRIDTLQAHIIDVQILFDQKNRHDLVNALEELLHYTREILKYEVISQEFPEMTILGMGADTLREKSHNPEKHFQLKQMVLVHYKMGEIISKLNFLRAYSRECELVAVTALKDTNPTIIQALNRLSSCFHILIYQELSKIGNTNG